MLGAPKMPAPPLSTGAQVHTDMQIQAILEVRTVRQYLVKWTNQTESWVLADDVQLQTSRITNANISVPQESQEYCVDVESGITSTTRECSPEIPFTPPLKRSARSSVVTPRSSQARSMPANKCMKKLISFVIDLLRDPYHDGEQIIQWENQREGIFRILQSEKVAKLWGLTKENPNMTYVKFARAMRYYYDSNVLTMFVKHNYPKKLVYKFHPSFDWESRMKI